MEERPDVSTGDRAGNHRQSRRVGQVWYWVCEVQLVRRLQDAALGKGDDVDSIIQRRMRQDNVRKIWYRRVRYGKGEGKFDHCCHLGPWSIFYRWEKMKDR